MKVETLLRAEFEAKRFLERVAILKTRNEPYSYFPNKETGAVRRASMDLSRALADLRRSEG